jgi:hypothetical protein
MPSHNYYPIRAGVSNFPVSEIAELEEDGGDSKQYAKYGLTI